MRPHAAHRAPEPCQTRLREVRNAFQAFQQIVYGSLSPQPWQVVFSDWRAKDAELREASSILRFDLVEMAQVLESAHKATAAAVGLDDDPATKSAAYLRACAACTPPALYDPQGWAHIEEALHQCDCAFFIRLGKRLEEKPSPESLAPNSLKQYLAWSWGPRFLQQVFWPGLAYMFNPARVCAATLLLGNKQVASEESLRAKWRRLGLIPAKKPFIRKVIQRGKNIEFA